MLGISSTELVLILFFGFLIFGPEKLPEYGRMIGRAIRQFRAASDQVNTKFKEEVYDPFQEAIDPYKEDISAAVDPIREDIESISDTFKETERMFKDPLDMQGKKAEMRKKEREFKESMGVISGSNAEDKQRKEADFKTNKEAVRSSHSSEGVDVSDPFAGETGSATNTAKTADDLSALYDFDSEDGE